MTDQSMTVRLVSRTIPSDDLTPILAYRRLVSADERDAPSFLLESVEVGGVMGRWSYLGANPQQLVEAHLGQPPPWVGCVRHLLPCRTPVVETFPPFRGGWVGWTAYEAAAWSEPTAIRPTLLNSVWLLVCTLTPLLLITCEVVHLQHVAQCDGDADAQARWMQ